MTQSTQRSRMVLLVLGIVFALLVWPAILLGHQAVSEANDQNGYHLPVIQKMAAEWPHIDLVNYNSATAPGYHLFLALANRFITADVRVLRLISSLFGLGLVLSVWHFTSARMNPWMALGCVAPLCASSYVLSGSMWLTTDNAAWMFVALALGLAVMVPITPGRIVGSSLLASLAVFVRQIHIWLIAPIGVAGLLRLRNEPATRTTVFISLLTLIVPVAVLLAMVLAWHGLVPPGSIEVNRLHSRGMNPTVVPMTLALFGVFGVFFVGSTGRLQIRSFFSDWRTWLFAVLALLVSMAMPTAYSAVQEDGRWGGAIWLVVRQFPAIGDRSIIVPPLAVLGALTLWLGWRRAAMAGNAMHGTLLLCAVACWLAAQSMNTQVWQRYLEPMILITLPWLISLASSRTASRETSRLEWIGPVVLAGLLLVLSLKTVYLPIITGATPT